MTTQLAALFATLETRMVRAGDAYYIPSNVRHGALCVEAGVLVDVFTPMREDFV